MHAIASFIKSITCVETKVSDIDIRVDTEVLESMEISLAISKSIPMEVVNEY